MEITEREFKSALRQLTYREALKARAELHTRKRYIALVDDVNAGILEQLVWWAEVWAPALNRRLPFYKRWFR